MSSLPETFRELFAAIPAQATALAIAAAWRPIVGSMPTVENRGDHWAVVFDMEQEDRASAWILSQLRREPGPVRMELGGVAQKVITRKYWALGLGLVVIGGLIGYSVRGK